MKINRKLSHAVLIAALMALVSTAVPQPAAAGLDQTGGAHQALLPITEWPVVGPVLQWLGVASSAVETPTPTPGLSEYRITSYEDLDNLKEIPSGERVRIIASESDLNAMILDAIAASVEGEARMALNVEPNRLHFTVWADQSLLEEAADYLPRQVRGDLDLTGTLALQASQCAPQVTVHRMRFNGWSFGLRLLAQRPINTRIREYWPDEICVERVLLMQDEAAVEGYRR
jgi:hypothetical protein